jgi:surface polysaccharide O-acyltransferase-like enzyme
MLMTACWGVVPMIFGKAFEASHLLWFFYLYSISGYIRLYGVKDKISLTGGKCILLAFLAEFLVLFLVDRTRIIRLNLLHYSAEYQFSTGEEGEQRFLLLITFVSVLLLIGFLKCSMKPKKIINSVSATTFGIYLIHDSLYLRPAIWTLLIGTRGEAAANGLLFIPYSIAVAAAVFLACMAAEMIRKSILEKHYLSALERAGLLIEQKLRKWEDSFDKEDSEV